MTLAYVIAFLLPGFDSSLVTRLDSKNWPATAEIITHSGVIEWDEADNTNYRSDIRTIYQVYGRNYQLRGIYAGQSEIGSNRNVEAVKISNRYREGKSVPVYFNPIDPNEAVLVTGIQAGMLLMLAIAIVSALPGVGLLLYSN